MSKKSSAPFHEASLVTFLVNASKLQQRCLDLEDAIVHALGDIMLTTCNTLR